MATLAAGRGARPTTLTVVAVVDEADGQPVIKPEPCDTGPDENLAYRLALLGARLVGATEVAIPVADYLRAQPDPLWGETLLG